MKRCLDLLGCVFLIMVLSPLIIVISLAVKVTSRGAVIFKQRRTGRGKREFEIYKFRTMYINTPQDIPTHLFEHPRKYITFVGGFLRKTSLDELPQLFNVLKGDMSFSGPRPALYNQYDLISLRESYGVNNVRPGMTGWAQVNGRDKLPITEKVEYDKYYVENQSLWLDIKIVLRTIAGTFTSRGFVEGKKHTANKNIQG